MKKNLISVIAIVSMFASVPACFSDVPSNAETDGDGNPVDKDGDGYSPPQDCNDADSSVHPGAPELCNGRDDNCDGHADEGLVGCNSDDTDKDGDGYSPPQDCNDADSSVHPGAPELCNGRDDNCNGQSDENCSGNGGGTGQSLGSRTLYAHYDRDADIDQAVFTKIWVMDAPNPDENGESTCAMNLWGVEGVDEVFVCPFIVPVGAKIVATAWTYRPDQQTTVWLFDMCDYPGGAGNCSGLGNFCEGAGDHILGRDFWWTRDNIDGAVVPHGWEDNKVDGLGDCTSNEVISSVP